MILQLHFQKLLADFLETYFDTVIAYVGVLHQQRDDNSCR